MARALDGDALASYCRRLGHDSHTRSVIETIRTSPPSRIPRARRGNKLVDYTSDKMGMVIKAESDTAEFAYLLQCEHDPDVLEIYDQPPKLPVRYRDGRGRVLHSTYTPDYFVLRYASAGWIECKQEADLVKLAKTEPHRYQLDDTGHWRCPPGEAYAQALGLTFSLVSTADVNWNLEANWRYLEDYYQASGRLSLPEDEVNLLRQLVTESPGISLTDLAARAIGVSRDHLNLAALTGVIYVDLAQYRLRDHQIASIPVFGDRAIALALEHPPDRAADEALFTQPVLVAPDTKVSWNGQPWRIASVGDAVITLLDSRDQPFSLPTATFENLVRQGRIHGVESGETSANAEETSPGLRRLLRASPVDLARALEREHTLHPERRPGERVDIGRRARSRIRSERTKRRWRARERAAEVAVGSGFVGLLTDYSNCGRRAIAEEQRRLIEGVCNTHYFTLAHAPKRGAYGEYLVQCGEQSMRPVSQTTFYRYVKTLRRKYDAERARGGWRQAYPYKEWYHSRERQLSVHGDYAWERGFIDHTPVDLALRHSGTSVVLGRAWLSTLFLEMPRRVVSVDLSFNAPSTVSCFRVIRRCVRRFGRLPTSIMVDGAKEFRSVAFETFLAFNRIWKITRPASEPRFGSLPERIYGTMNTEFIYHLLGNTQLSKEPRKLSPEADPYALSVWTLPALAARCRAFLEEEYDTTPQDALQGLSPRLAFEHSLLVDGEREHREIPFTLTFQMSTWELTPRGVAKVHTGAGVQINYGTYWCDEMANSAIEETSVPVRYDDDNVTQAAAYIDGQWRLCHANMPALEGCSFAELHLLAAEYRQQQRLAHGPQQVQVKQEHLALFRRENAALEALLLRQRKDAEMREASRILDGGSADFTPQAAPQSTEAHSADFGVRSLSRGSHAAEGGGGANGGQEGEGAESVGLPVSSLEASNIHLRVFPTSR